MGDQMEYYVVESMLWLWYPYVGVGTRGGCMGGSELAGGSPRRGGRALRPLACALISTEAGIYAI